MDRQVIFAITLVLVSAPSARCDDALIASMDEPRFQPPKEKGRAEIVEGKVGRATHFSFDKDARGVFFTSNIRGTPEWDKAEGFSFWVKGDGGDGLGGLEFIYDDDYAVRYDLAFPTRETEWTKVTVAWDDLIPVLPGPHAKPLGTPEGNRPSKLSGLWIGKWWYWGDYPPVSFTIDDIRLEPKVARDAKDYRGDVPPLQRLRDKLKAGEPITIVTMGDSLTDTHHWANREVVWPSLVKESLEKSSKSKVTIVNPAIGGTQLRQNLVLVPGWLRSHPHPDLVTIFFGGNDWDAGMRGPEFEAACADAIDRVRRATDGKTDVLLITTNPAASRWGTTAELAASCRKAARERNAGLADTESAFKKSGKAEADRNRLFVDDRVHLSRDGHRVVADTVVKAIQVGGR